MGIRKIAQLQKSLKMPNCPAEIVKKFEEHGFEKEWVQGEYDIFISNYPAGKMTKADVMDPIKTAAAERCPNADPQNLADALYPAFDPEDKGEIGFIGAATGLAVLFCARIEVRAQLFFSLVDEAGDGKISKAEMKKFLVFINETQALGLADGEINGLNDEIFSTLGKTELTLDDVRDVAAARWG